MFVQNLLIYYYIWSLNPPFNVSTRKSPKNRAFSGFFDHDSDCGLPEDPWFSKLDFPMILY